MRTLFALGAGILVSVVACGGSSSGSDGTRIGTWTRAAPMANVRAGHSATLLASGLVLVDPAAAAWKDGAPMPVDPGDAPAAALLPGGKVLVTGGFAFGSTWAAIDAVQVFVE